MSKRASRSRSSTPMRGLLDTSVLIAEGASEMPDEASISAASLAEIHFGVHVAPDEPSRRARLRRLTEIEATFDPLPIDDRVARAYGALADVVRSTGRNPRTRVMDVLIAATAQVHDVPLFTKNKRDFGVFEGLIELRYV